MEQMVNEAVTEIIENSNEKVLENFDAKTFGKGMVCGAVAELAIGAGLRFVVKPTIAKIKSKIEGHKEKKAKGKEIEIPDFMNDEIDNEENND